MGVIFWTAGGPVETTTPPAVLGDLPWRLDNPVWIPGHLDSHPHQSSPGGQILQTDQEITMLLTHKLAWTSSPIQ